MTGRNPHRVLSEEESLPANRLRLTDDGKSHQSAISLDKIFVKFKISAVSGTFPPLSSKNSGIMASFNDKENDEDFAKEGSPAKFFPKIYKAVDSEKQEEYVCKLVTGENAELELEVLQAASSETNEFLVKLVNYFQLMSNRHLFLFQYVMYGNLNELFNKFGPYPLDLPTCARITKSLANGLDFLHRRSITHGFVNPEHCLLDDLGNVRLCGLSNLFKGQKADTYRWIDNMGRTIYFAPEVCFPEQSVNPFSVDMFACGVVFHRCLLGVFPRTLSPSVSYLKSLVRKTKACAKHSFSSTYCVDYDVLSEMEGPLKMIRDLLTAKPSFRPGACAVLSSDWIKKAFKCKSCLPLSVFSEY